MEHIGCARCTGSLRMATGRLLGDEAGGAKAPIAAREPRQVPQRRGVAKI